jgi:hypothetical protein
MAVQLGGLLPPIAKPTLVRIKPGLETGTNQAGSLV